MFIALVVAATLNAKGMRKTAHGQPAGAGRNVAVALTDGLSAVTGVLQIDEPRKVLQAAIGRGDEDRVSESIRFTSNKRGHAQAPPREKPVYTARKPLKLWITGDSLMGDPGKVLVERLHGKRAYRTVGQGVDTRAGTGLARPDVFNWFEWLPPKVRALKPAVTILAFGGNDGQSLFGDGGGQHFDTPEWKTEYARRVGGLMDEVAAAGSRQVWIGLPIPRASAMQHKYALMNDIFRREAAKRPGRIAFVDLWRRFEDKQGHYADYLPDESGKLVKMRKPDGVHFEFAAAEIVASEIQKALPRLVTVKP
jgi:uncharacterized protein